MAFLRHVGKHGERKVAVVYREVPGEPHMCLVVYTESLNQSIHDPLIKVIESNEGQSAPDLAISLNTNYTIDGHIILQRLHAEGLLKKINTDQVIMLPSPNVRIKLKELNEILDKMAQGESAVREMEDMDASMGLQHPADIARRMRGDKFPANSPLSSPFENPSDVLSDDSIVKNLMEQATRMETEANAMIAESKRLMAEAQALLPPDAVSVKKTRKPRTPKIKASA